MKEQSKSVRIQAERSKHREHSVPIYMTSSFVFDSAEQAAAVFADEEEGIIYSRYSNPNSNELIEKMCALENTEAGMSFASGMSAVFSSIAAFLSSGDHIVASRAVFGSTHQLFTQVFPKWGITTTYVDASATKEEWDQAIQSNTKMVFVESPSNPGLELIDLELLGGLCRKHGLIFNVDNCFATPVFQRPADFGADLISHSATKYIDGQGRVLGGVLLGRKELIDKAVFFARHTGPALSPFNAWTLSKSLETLQLRMERHAENALKLAAALEGHKALEKVNYPFLASHPSYELAKRQMKAGGGILTIVLKGGYESATLFMNKLKMIKITSNLGDSRTIATHPASTTHSKLSEAERQAVNIQPGLVRISVGLEDANDILQDILEALS
ncbi:MAG: aminotransferase class I/II-fold pyridoxal phosphate-dependent enzyme [Cyclobacteriaceae bacterium]|nr:aminotransferase class I/II-fold pyridoxal phosphate-dependent enzyme [Cyclobacteriaceae bacterium]MCH8515702.1 aminotransferase class I/II-fold pyridoxal phosphate-dependent enzyme [Cyclobacteriaceae bacterium]